MLKDKSIEQGSENRRDRALRHKNSVIRWTPSDRFGILVRRFGKSCQDTLTCSTSRLAGEQVTESRSWICI